MAIIDKIKVGSTTYDVSPSASGTLNTTGTTKFASSDVTQGSATSWTSVNQITTADNHATLFTKITQMAKNVRYLYNVLGTGFSTGSTVKGQIDGKAAASHSHKVAQLPTSSTQVNSNDYIPTSALIYSMNQTLTSLNDASLKVKNITTVANSTSTLIILNGYGYDGQISGDLDVYKYWVLSMLSNKHYIFPELSFIATTPSDDFPYDAMQISYVWKLDEGNLVATTNMTIKWKMLCIPR